MARKNEQFAEAVKVAMRQRGYRNAMDLHRASGINRTTCYSIRDGTPPRGRNLLKMARALGGDLEDWVLLAAGETPCPIVADGAAAYESDRRHVIAEATEEVETVIAGLVAAIGEQLRRIREA